MAIAGVDIGTTGCKCSVYSENGELLNEAYREYSSTITPEYHCISPIKVWESIKEVIKEASGGVEDLKGIVITSYSIHYTKLYECSYGPKVYGLRQFEGWNCMPTRLMLKEKG